MNFLGLIIFYFSCVYAATYVTISNETLLDHIAAFGPRISLNGKLGFLAESVTDPNGCNIVDPPCTDWIALVKRGGCSFVTKVRMMQKSGAVAVVVGDSEKSGWITMFSSGDTSDIVIPSVFLAKNEYKRILHLLKLLKSPLMIVLQSNDDIVDWPITTDLFFIIILSPCIMLLFTYILWKIRQFIRIRKQLASASAVSKLGIKIFNEKEEESCCAICLEDYEKGSELRLLPCNHQFHTFCVDAWLMTQRKLCPICKRDITLNV